MQSKQTAWSGPTLLNSVSTHHQKRNVLGICLILLVISMAILPFAGDVNVKVNPFLPIYVTAITACSALTALLLYHQFRIHRHPALLVLAATYLFAAMASWPYLLMTPGVFSPAGWLHAGIASATWMWIFWHGSVPIGLIGYAALYRNSRNLIHPKLIGRYVWGSVLGAVALLVSYTLISVDILGTLPHVVVNDDSVALVNTGVGPLLCALNLVALWMIGARSRTKTVLDTWLILVCFTALMDTTLTLGSDTMYSLGWYAARFNSLLTASVVLTGLLYDIQRLYAKVVEETKEIHEIAYHDVLTGLGNRRLFQEEIRSVMRHSTEIQKEFSVLLLDLDGFKAINDTYGHEYGDELLHQTAIRLVDSVRECDTVVRFGGDEFAMILTGTSRTDAALIAERVLGELSKPMLISEDLVQVTASIGLSQYPHDGRDATKLLRVADQALYDAKARGKNRVTLGKSIG